MGLYRVKYFVSISEVKERSYLLDIQLHIYWLKLSYILECINKTKHISDYNHFHTKQEYEFNKNIDYIYIMTY